MSMPNRDHITKVKSVLPQKQTCKHASSQALQCVASQGRGKLCDVQSHDAVNASWLCHRCILFLYQPNLG